ncbi:PEP-CTERM sorting domain-containing protein [Opitutus sp. ER46]|uniref:PEP-CTERM sorting domain-containing protein n=1 Tax=Opitutus sp. ER46 TaxID=2161864 RepID=UPI000D31CE00|nr:PEP-CTERM sorting domain-containing protein [Opitutus sp. ER46]PTX95681.1 hypothetical protein DB354_09720 [Opitutus sp. ER46]
MTGSQTRWLRHARWALLLWCSALALPASPVWDWGGNDDEDDFDQHTRWGGSGVPSLLDHVRISHGTVRVLRAWDIGTLELAGGKLRGGSNTVSLHSTTASSVWSAGTLRFSSGGGVTVQPGAFLTISGATDHVLDGATLTNYGAVYWSATGHLVGGSDDGVFVNQVGATFTKASAGDTQVSGVAFHNAGSVIVDQGRLKLASGGSLGDHAAFVGAGTTVLTGGAFTAYGTVLAENLVLDGATLQGTLTLSGMMDFVSGTLGAGGTTTVAGGSVLTLSGDGDHGLDQHTLTNDGVVNWTGGTLSGDHGATLVNEGIFHDGASSSVNAGANANSFLFINRGSYGKDGAGTSTMNAAFVNDGVVSVLAGRMVFNGAFTNRGSIVLAGGAVAQFGGPLTFGTDTYLVGRGTIEASRVIAGGWVAPGNSAGTLTITGDFDLLSTSVLLIELGGTTPGTGYDFLDVSGQASLDGTLAVLFVGGYGSLVQSADTFTFLRAAGVSGTFANLSGGRVFTLDGSGSFAVTIGATSVSLSDFQAVPEPATYMLLAGGGALLFGLRRRRR